MTYREAEQVGLKRQRSKQAIAMAMEGRWREAIAINREILEGFPNDVEAYNRLGKAYMELGEYSQAIDAYKQAIEIDSYNTVALKNLQRLSQLGEVAVGSEGEFDRVAPQLFIEEVGKAGVVMLNHLGSPQTLARVANGDRVYLKTDGPNLTVENARGDYLGQVEPRHGQRLARLVKGGNQFTATVVSSAEDRMTVIIREVYQHPSQVGRPSFPAREVEGLRTYFSDRILKRELQNEEALASGPGYTIIGEGGAEPLPEDVSDLREGDDEEMEG